MASELTELHMAKYGNGAGDFGLVKGVEAAAALEDAMHQRFVLMWDDVQAGDRFSPLGFCFCGGSFPTLRCKARSGGIFPLVILQHVRFVVLHPGMSLPEGAR